MAASEIINVVMKFSTNINEGLKRAETRVKGFRDALGSAERAFRPISIAAGAALGVSSKMALDFEKAMLGVAKSLNLDTTEAVDRFKKSIQELQRSLDFQLGATELANIAANAAKVGVAENEIAEFTKGLVKLAVAADSLDSIEELNLQVAKIKNTFQLSLPQLERYYGALALLADNTASSEKELIKFTQIVGGSAATANISAQNTAALGATLISAGNSAGTAATSAKKFITVLATGGQATKASAKAFADLGLNSAEFAARFRKNPTEAMREFIQVINRVKQSRPEDIDLILLKIFGLEHIDNAKKLSAQIGNFEKNLNLSNDALAGANKLTSEYQKQVESVPGQIKLMQNQLGALAIEIGSAVIPSINDLLTEITPLIRKFVEFAQANPGITKTIVVLLTIASVVAPILAAVSAIAGMISALTALAPLAAGAAAAIGAISLPAVAVAAAIAGLVAAGVALYQNWDVIKAKAGEVWGHVKNIVGNVLDYLASIPGKIVQAFDAVFPGFRQRTSTLINGIKEDLVVIGSFVGSKLVEIGNNVAQKYQQLSASISNFVKPYLDNLKVVVNAVWSEVSKITNHISQTTIKGFNIVKDAFSGVLNSIKSAFDAFIPQFVNFGKSMMSSLSRGITDTALLPLNAVKSLTGKIRDLLPSSPAKEGALADLDKVGLGFGKTIIEGIERSGLIDYLQTNLRLPELGQRVNTAVGNIAGGLQRGLTPQAAPVTLNNTYNITGSKVDAEFIVNALRTRDRELIELIERSQQRYNRRVY